MVGMRNNSDYVHKNCQLAFAEEARLASGMELISQEPFKVRGTEKKFDNYCKFYRKISQKNSVAAYTAEFLVDGKQLCRIL